MLWITLPRQLITWIAHPYHGTRRNGVIRIQSLHSVEIVAVKVSWSLLPRAAPAVIYFGSSDVSLLGLCWTLCDLAWLRSRP